MCITYGYLSKYLHDDTNDDCDYGMAAVSDNSNWLDQLAERTQYASSMRGR